MSFQAFFSIYRGFCAPPTTNLAPFWPHFGSYFPKNYFFQIFPIIFGYIFMFLAQRAVVLAKKSWGQRVCFRVMPENASRAEICSKLKKWMLFRVYLPHRGLERRLIVFSYINTSASVRFSGFWYLFTVFSDFISGLVRDGDLHFVHFRKIMKVIICHISKTI